MAEHHEDDLDARGAAERVLALADAGANREFERAYADLVRRLDQTAEGDVRVELLRGMVRTGKSFEDQWNLDRAQAIYTDILQRFGPDERPDIAEHVEWTRTRHAQFAKALAGTPQRPGRGANEAAKSALRRQRG